MEKELDPEVIKATQNSLGKFVKRPPLTDKLLKKPPFRFLHDIVTTVLKTTGFFEGLFEEHELVSDNVKDRESKIAFLTKVIAVVGLTTGKALTVKSTKIVAGQEPEKTNELLQYLALALDKKLSSDEAVTKFKNGEKLPANTKTKDAAKPAKKINENHNETKKLTSKSTEKLTSNKRDTKDRSLTRNEKDKVNKVNVAKTKQKENAVAKKESPPKKTSQQGKTILKKNSIDKQPQNDHENITPKNINSVPSEPENVQTITTYENGENDQDSGVSLAKHDVTDSVVTTPPQIIPNTEQGDLGNTSFTIVENDLNSSLSSQDLMEVDNDNAHGNHIENTHIDEFGAKVEHNDYELSKLTISSHTSNILNTEENTRANRNGNGSGPQSLTKDTDKRSAHNSQGNKIERMENTAPVTRPKSVRPSSSRPGAPRLREKYENVLAGNDNLLVGKVNIIVENTSNEEEEDASIIILDQPTETSTTYNDHQEHLISSNQHGHLVQQILDSQKEFSQSSGKTEIEWQFGAQKAREAVNQEVEQLRFNIQALSRVTNPLGKLLDHIQEDVEVMRQELQQWMKTYEEASKELQKEKTANEDSLYPLHSKLKQLDVDIDEKRDKINDLKIVIYKNSSRIEKLLTSGDVQ